jgi:ankyrin repeat protein
MVELLLEHGAEAATAEHLGPVAAGDTRIARLLISRGLDINLPVRGRDTFLCRVCRGDKGEKPETAQTLIDLGADVNGRNYRGRTPLHVAARAGFCEVIEVLLRSSADVDVVDGDGMTPLALALAAARTPAAEMLRRWS